MADTATFSGAMKTTYPGAARKAARAYARRRRRRKTGYLKKAATK